MKIPHANTALMSTLASALVLSLPVVAADHDAIHQMGAILSPSDSTKISSFDILAAHVHREGRTVTFHMSINGKAGAETPKTTGRLNGSLVYGYVWPTSLDPSTIGFEENTGILALAVTSHPDFDDTPLYDENADGDLTNDGALWHSHWVVLKPTKACGEDALAVRDILKNETPKLPATWSGLPILIDSPGYTPQFDGSEVKVTVAFADLSLVSGVDYDGLTVKMLVNTDAGAPLLCVTDVFDIASGNLSLPGKIK